MSIGHTQTMKKTVLAAGDLFALLEREIRRRSPRECGACDMPMPYMVAHSHEYESNWQVLMPGRCGMGCSDVIEEIVADFQQRYALPGGPDP